MNERINELWRLYFVGDLGYDEWKFAQFIVKECIQLANDEASRFYNMDEYELASVMENFREKLKEHFGVKE